MTWRKPMLEREKKYKQIKRNSGKKQNEQMMKMNKKRKTEIRQKG